MILKMTRKFRNLFLVDFDWHILVDEFSEEIDFRVYRGNLEL